MNFALLKSFCAGVKNPGATILHYAVRCGSTKVIDFILRKHKGKETSQVWIIKSIMNLQGMCYHIPREAKLQQ